MKTSDITQIVYIGLRENPFAGILKSIQDKNLAIFETKEELLRKIPECKNIITAKIVYSIERK